MKQAVLPKCIQSLASLYSITPQLTVLFMANAVRISVSRQRTVWLPFAQHHSSVLDCSTLYCRCGRTVTLSQYCGTTPLIPEPNTGYDPEPVVSTSNFAIYFCTSHLTHSVQIHYNILLLVIKLCWEFLLS
jgi:hypothetical protein